MPPRGPGPPPRSPPRLQASHVGATFPPRPPPPGPGGGVPPCFPCGCHHVTSHPKPGGPRANSARHLFFLAGLRGGGVSSPSGRAPADLCWALSQVRGPRGLGSRPGGLVWPPLPPDAGRAVSRGRPPTPPAASPASRLAPAGPRGSLRALSRTRGEAPSAGPSAPAEVPCQGRARGRPQSTRSG